MLLNHSRTLYKKSAPTEVNALKTQTPEVAKPTKIVRDIHITIMVESAFLQIQTLW